MIQENEEISMNAWPALQTVVYDGWILRFANGYTRRANSVNPIYPSKIDLKRKVAYCQRLYDQRNLPTIFKITKKVYPQNLESELKKADYRHEAETSVQTVDLCTLEIPRYVPVKIARNVSAQWIDHFVRLNKLALSHRVTIRSMLESIKIPTCFAAITDEKNTVACGMGVLDRETVGLFDIVVDEHYRGGGFATRLVYGILDWAKNNNAKLGYLQVMLENKDALSLYGRIGFREVYRYWYRVRDIHRKKE